MKNRINDESSVVPKAKKSSDESPSKTQESPLAIYGFHPIPAGGKPVTNKLVNDLREESGI